MQLTGPRSLSSVVRTGLDLARIGVLFGLLVVGLVAASLLILFVLTVAGAPMAPEFFSGLYDGITDGRAGPYGLLGLAALTGVMCSGLAYLVALLIILTALRQLFASLSRGEVFDRSNGKRLRSVGFGLIAVELITWFASALDPIIGEEERWSAPLNPTGWFAIAVVFVLAEVFREGARLRRQSELTI